MRLTPLIVVMCCLTSLLTYASACPAENSALEQKELVPQIRQYKTDRDFRGKLVFAFDTAVYGSGGFAPAWKSYLIFRDFNKTSKVAETSVIPNTKNRHQVSVPSNKFLYDPVFSPDGRYVALKMGDPFSVGGTYQLYLWQVPTHSILQVTSALLQYRRIVWSPDSSHLSYVRGAGQNSDLEWQKPKLCVYNVSNKQEREIEGFEPISSSIIWTSSNTLLFSALSLTEPSSQISPPSMESGRHINIYEVSPSNGLPKLLISNAYKAFPSPDFKSIVYFKTYATPSSHKGPLLNKKLEVQSGLVLAGKGGQFGRMLKSRSNATITDVRWRADNRRLIIVHRSFTPFNAQGAGTTSVTIEGIDTVSGDSKDITSFSYQVFSGTDLTEDDSLLNILKVSKDRKYLFYSLLQFGRLPSGGMFLKSIDLDSGKISTLCRIGTVRGLDWYDESKP